MNLGASRRVSCCFFFVSNDEEPGITYKESRTPQFAWKLPMRLSNPKADEPNGVVRRPSFHPVPTRMSDRTLSGWIAPRPSQRTEIAVSSNAPPTSEADGDAEGSTWIASSSAPTLEASSSVHIKRSGPAERTSITSPDNRWK